MRKLMVVLLGCVAVAGVGQAFLPVGFAQAKEGALVLFDFESADDVAKWEANGSEMSVSTEHATSGKQSMKVVLKPGEYPGLSTGKIEKDWSAYKELKLDVFADAAFTIAVRIDDDNSKDYASRYNNEGVEIAKGQSTVTLTLGDVGDKIDLKKVKMLCFFAINPDKDITFYVDNVRLEK